MRRLGLGMTMVLVLAAAAPSWADINVVRPHSQVAGRPIGAWTAEWWKWAGSFTRDENPIFDRTGEHANLHQSGPVFFIPGSTSKELQPVERTFRVPGDKYLLIPLINWIVANGIDDPAFADTREEAIAVTTGTIDPRNLFIEIDGHRVPTLRRHREKTPDFFTITIVDNFPVVGPPGTYDDAFADGYWIMLNPLGEGEHVLHFGGTTRDYTSPTGAFHINSFSLDITSHVEAEEDDDPESLMARGADVQGPLE